MRLPKRHLRPEVAYVSDRMPSTATILIPLGERICATDLPGHDGFDYYSGMCFRHRLLPAAMGIGLLVNGITWAQQEMHQLKLDVDPLLDLPKLWEFSPDSLEKQFTAPHFRENPYISWQEGDKTAAFLTQPFTNVQINLSALSGSLPVAEARVEFGPQRARTQRLILSADKATPSGVEKLRAHLNTLLETVPQPGPRPALGWKADAALKSEIWRGTRGNALLSRADTNLRLTITPAGIDPAGESLLSAIRRNQEMAFFVRLDQLLPMPALWSMDTDAMEKTVVIPGLGLTDNPFFKWNTVTKESARFARQLFSNTSADLLLFDDTVNAEEANIEFKNGRASKLIVTLLSRGNSGNELSAQQFDSVFKSTGRALGQMLGVRPTNTTVSGKTISKTNAYLWTTPHTLALLEYNVEAPKGQVEFLRLTFTPGSARSELLNLAGIGNNATTRSRITLASSIKRDAATGDVEIAGVPMRDQGQKGYCVAASCERLLRYLNVPCDMDELAQLVRADADRGASPAVMYSALQKIDQRFNMHMKLLKLPTGYSLGPSSKRNELERAWKSDLNKLIQDNINQGLPLLWAVALPPGESGLGTDNTTTPNVSARSVPDSMRAGHMRMIIGYNTKTRGVIYTDSWGAGHERKVMTFADAEEMTRAVFSMTPSR